MKQKPITIYDWLTQYPPKEKDYLIEAAWLDEHAAYGGGIHEVVADAILEALKQPRNRYEGHALYFKLFAEYANALEVAGALGWAIRERKAGALLLDTFLTYKPDKPRLFYEAAQRNRSGSIALLLGLPSERKVLAALDAASPASDEHHRKALNEAVPLAKYLAGRYLAKDEAVRLTYNRAKHGATMLHADSHTLRQFCVIAPDLSQESRYLVPTFTATSEQIRLVRRGVELAGAMIQFLATLAKGLNSTDALYGLSPPLAPKARRAGLD
jgi:hypothetical protein